jgi:hypothetical protein
MIGGWCLKYKTIKNISWLSEGPSLGGFIVIGSSDTNHMQVLIVDYYTWSSLGGGGGAATTPCRGS